METEDFIGVFQSEVEVREARKSIKVNLTRHPLTVSRPLNNPNGTASSLFSNEGKAQCVYILWQKPLFSFLQQDIQYK